MYNIKKLFNEFEDYDLYFVNSSLSALFIILSYLKKINRITDKNSQILVSRYLPSEYYNTINHVAFPSTFQSKNIEGMVVFHQNGFAQNMDEILNAVKDGNLFLIEDCSESLKSFSNKKRLGTFSSFSIFDLSRYFPTVYGGLIFSREKYFSEYISNLVQKSPKLISNIYYISNYINKKFPRVDFFKTIKTLFDNSAQLCFELNYKQKQRVLTSIANNKNYRDFKKILKIIKNNYLSNFIINENDYMPISLIIKKDGLDRKLFAELKPLCNPKILNFDINRNILNPKFIETYEINLFQNSNKKVLEKIGAILR